MTAEALAKFLACRVLFERNYLASPKPRERVAEARLLVQAVDDTIVEERVIVPIKPTTS